MRPQAALSLGLLVFLLSCNPHTQDRASSSTTAEQAFARKRACYQLGQARLAKDQADDPGPGILIDGEWCYQKTLNTCIYASQRQGLSLPLLKEQ